MRLADESDAPQMQAFLAGHADSSMWLRSALAGKAAEFWIWPAVGAPEPAANAGRFGLMPDGTALARASRGLPAAALRSAGGRRGTVAGRRLTGPNGPPRAPAPARSFGAIGSCQSGSCGLLALSRLQPVVP